MLNLPLVLTNALGQAVRWGLLSVNPAAWAQPPRPRRPLDEDLWTVSQHRSSIHPGDRVYFWESGPAGGVIGGLALSQIISQP